MTVKELIDALASLDQEAEVICLNDESGASFFTAQAYKRRHQYCEYGAIKHALPDCAIIELSGVRW
jgi:hypothetical protein